MKKHNRQGEPSPYAPKGGFVCTHCKAGACNMCVDIMRVIVNLAEICKCPASGHAGEPRDQQVQDPFTGDVHAPGLVVRKDGEVERRE